MKLALEFHQNINFSNFDISFFLNLFYSVPILELFICFVIFVIVRIALRLDAFDYPNWYSYAFNLS